MMVTVYDHHKSKINKATINKDRFGSKVQYFRQKSVDIDRIMNKLVLTGGDIIDLGEGAESLVGGKNYNIAIISQIPDILTPQFRAISSIAFHKFLNETKINAQLVHSVVNKEYNRINWADENINNDSEFLRNLVHRISIEVKTTIQIDFCQTFVKLCTFVNNIIEDFVTSYEDIDQLRKCSVLIQVAILSVDLPDEVQQVICIAYRDICKEVGINDIPVAVRSSAAGEDSCKKAFAGLQDTYLNIIGEQMCVNAYHWNCASAYNLRSMTYRYTIILDAISQAEATGNDEIAINAKREWAIENTSLSVCLMRMVDPIISGTAFSADTTTGCRGTDRHDLVSIDASYGLGEVIVGGIVTPDKFYVFQRDDKTEVVVRYMGKKDKQVIYGESSGTKLVAVPSDMVFSWSLSQAQAEKIAKGVRAISMIYGGIIIDTEFCIDASNQLFFVQARPETRWNKEFKIYPYSIFMNRLEVSQESLAKAEIIMLGNGASRGAGRGVVRFLRSALELNKIKKGDILAAERTDPDMVPGMRIASAILSDVGGDTSHAAITSRELGIPAVIGIQHLEALRALDSHEVTVDGSRGCIYRGLLPLVEVNGEIDISILPSTNTKIGLILADVDQSMFLSRLRQVIDFEVGLLRAEFMLGNIGVHPLALEAYDHSTIKSIVKAKLQEYDNELTKILREQLAKNIVSLELQLRPYVARLTGLWSQLEILSNMTDNGSMDDTLAIHREFNDIECQIDEYVHNATKYLEVLKTSTNLEEHVRCVFGLSNQLDYAANNCNENIIKCKQGFTTTILDYVAKVKDDPEVIATLNRISTLRSNVAQTTGLAAKMEAIRSVPDKIAEIIHSHGYRSGKEHYIQILAQNLALFAMAFYGKPILYRTTDFKSNEYRNLIGGSLFEQFEDNPMLGYRGVSRNIHDWELEAFKLARSFFGGINLQLMFPFVRTLEEARSMKHYVEQVHNLKSGVDGLKIILMSEIPSNAILAKAFIQEFDGFSIGSNDMTQMVLATDRDNSRLTHIYDEEDPAVIWAILCTIFTGQKYGKKVGFCGQGVSNSIILRGVVTIAGIISASVVPDTYYRTKLDIAAIEHMGIPTSSLGAWLAEQHLVRLKELLKQHNYIHILRDNETSADFVEWYKSESLQLLEQLRENLGSNKEKFYRQKLEHFRNVFHKPVIYADWDWHGTVEDALHQAGFVDFAEQAEARAIQRSMNW